MAKVLLSLRVDADRLARWKAAAAAADLTLTAFITLRVEGRAIEVPPAPSVEAPPKPTRKRRTTRKR